MDTDHLHLPEPEPMTMNTNEPAAGVWRDGSYIDIKLDESDQLWLVSSKFHGVRVMREGKYALSFHFTDSDGQVIVVPFSHVWRYARICP